MNTITACLRRIAILPGLPFTSYSAVSQQDQESAMKAWEAYSRPMEGMGTLAYDNAKKQFESTWIDNVGSGIMKATGSYDPSTKTLIMKGMQTDPMTGKDIPFRETHGFVDDNTQVMEMYMAPDGARESKPWRSGLPAKCNSRA